MIDSKARSCIRGYLIGILLQKNTWHEYHGYYENIKTADRGARLIADNLWIIYDPEFPENKKSLDCYDLCRILIFLESYHEYTMDKNVSSDFWPFANCAEFQAALLSRAMYSPDDV